ncbi:MAG TPA: DUF1330 domain-containing protein [Acetobacteraceae bacterium]|nr:DUF1330 domain-containing protein [Acetobacteraceae bacterium]
MKIRYAVTVSVLSGMAIGIAGVQALHAQAKPPVYMIALNEVTDPDGYRHEYLPPAQASIKQYGGVYVAAGPGTAVEGELPKGRIVVLRWDSLEALQRWRTSPEYTAAHKIGLGYAKYNIVAVNGVTQ